MEKDTEKGICGKWLKILFLWRELWLEDNRRHIYLAFPSSYPCVVLFFVFVILV